jgi:hypothetical protein
MQLNPQEGADMSILDEAKEVVYGDREKTYGDPAKNLKTIAAMWGAILGYPIATTDVCLCMSALKLARLVNDPGHHDSMVDVCGYIALLERVQS